MKLHPRVTKTAVELVKRFEGLRRRAARLPDGGWTIGYGHTKTAREGAEVSPDEAELLLYYDLSEVATKVEAWTFTPLNQNQFEALTAFAFNIGAENFRGSTVLRRVNEGHHLQAAAAMELWRKTEVNGEGIVIDALVRRRAAEKAHFLTPPEGFRPSPSQVLRPAFDFSVVEAATQTHAPPRAPLSHAAFEEEEVAPFPAETPKPATPPASLAAEAIEPFPKAKLEEEHSGHALVEDAVLADGPFLAAATLEPAVQAPEAPSGEPAPESPMNDISDPNDPFPTTVVSTPVARSFEPPPSRFDRAPESMTAAGEHQGASAFAGQSELEIPGGLFGRPSATPSQTYAAEGGAGAASPEITPQRPAKPRLGGALGKAMGNRTLVWAVVGGFGLLFFVLAVLSMLFGRASLAHLVVGFIGVLLLTPAGIYFLLRRSAEAPQAPAAPEVKPVEPVQTPE